MTAHQPFRVVARLAAGIAHTYPWSISLDGLLAAQLWQLAKPGPGPDHTPALDADYPPDLDLPLARCTPTTQPDAWHWAATCGYPDPVPDRPDIHTWTGTLDHRAMEQLTSALPKVISTRQGRYRPRHMPLPVLLCATITWTAVGDPHATEELLHTITGIGKKRSHGEGHVLDWTVTPADDLDPFSAGHLTPAGTLGRPCPPDCLTLHPAIAHGGAGLIGIRPPVMHPSRRHHALLPAPLTPPELSVLAGSVPESPPVAG